MKQFYKDTILPSSLLAGTIIGAGVFALPYVFIKTGLLVGLLSFLLFCLLFVYSHLMYAEVIVKNGTQHRFAGYSKIYFGKFGYGMGIIMSIIQAFFVLSIYLILSSSFIASVFPQINTLYGVLGFWLLGSVIIYAGTKKLTFFEFLSLVGIILVIVGLFFLGFQKFFSNSFPIFSENPLIWLMPFGPLLFSLSGRPAVPALVHYFEKIGIHESSKKIKRAVIFGTLTAAFVYSVFIISVLGLTPSPSPDTLTAIAGVIPYWALVGLGVLGLLSLISSYFAIGLDLKNSLKFDLNFSNISALLFVFFIPLFLFWMKVGGLISLIEFAGGVFIGIEGIMILKMWKKSLSQGDETNSIFKKIPTPVYYLFMTIYVVSIVYAILFAFNKI